MVVLLLKKIYGNKSVISNLRLIIQYSAMVDTRLIGY